MLLISGSSTSPTLAIPDDRLFRTCSPDDVQAPALADMWETGGAEAVLIFHRGDMWGNNLRNILNEELKDRGIKVLEKIWYPSESTEFYPYLYRASENITDWIEKGNDVERVGMQFFSFDELRTIQNQAVGYDYLNDIIWMTTESGGRNQQMLDEAGELAAKTRHFSPLLTFDETSTRYQDFAEKYYELTGEMPGYYTAVRYDACWLLAETIIVTQSTDAGVIAENLIPISETYIGVSGCLALDENGDRIPKTFDIWGFYEDPENAGEYTFGKFGSYDAPTIEVYWDDDFLEYTGITRPGK